MTELRIGSVCTGSAALDHAVQAVLGGEMAWVCDPDPAAAALLKHHYPEVPNLGDLTSVNWEEVVSSESLAVDVLTAGFP